MDRSILMKQWGLVGRLKWTWMEAIKKENWFHDSNSASMEKWYHLQANIDVTRAKGKKK